MKNIVPTATRISTSVDATLELHEIRTSSETESAHHTTDKQLVEEVDALSPTSLVRKEAHRLNKKAETSKRKRNRYSFDLGLNNNGSDIPVLPLIIESKSRETSRPPSPSRTLSADEHREMTREGSSRYHEEGSLAQQHFPATVPTEGGIDPSDSGRRAVSNENSLPRECRVDGQMTSFSTTTDVRHPMPLSRSAISSTGTSPNISRYASPAAGYSSNASYHDSLGDSGILDGESDGALSQGRASISAFGSRNRASSEVDTEEEEVDTARFFSARLPWSRSPPSGQPSGRRTSNSQWPWHSRRLTIDLLRDCQPVDHKLPHARKPSTEHSPLNRQESETSLAARHESSAYVNSSSQSLSSHGNPLAGSERIVANSQYPDYQSLPHYGDDLLLPKTHPDSTANSFSPDLGQHRRSLRQFLGWMRRRIGLGASGVVELATEASQRVANSAGGQVRLPPGSTGSRRRSRRRANIKGRKDDTFWLVKILHLVPTQPLTIVSQNCDLSVKPKLTCLCSRHKLLSLLIFGAFAVTLTISLKYLLNPDKAPLPWRDYCQSPYPSYFALQYPADYHPTPVDHSTRLAMEKDLLTWSTPTYSSPRVINSTHPMWPFQDHNDMPYSAESSEVDKLKPVGVFVGVFTMDEGRDRRMLIRQTYGAHPKSRVPGTEGVRIKFIMGQPRARYERSVKLEMEGK